MKKIINTIISLLLSVVLLAGCSDESAKGIYDKDAVMNKLSSDVVAENEKLELSWNGKGKFVSLYDKASKKIWSTVPFEYFKNGGTSDNVNSPLNITVANAAKAQWDTVNGYSESVKRDRVSAKKIDNGIEVTYYFDNYSVSVPIRYELKDDCLKMSVNSAEIVEEGSSVLLSLAVAPFLCSAENTEKDSYLFIPSGSGGLMYVDERAEGTRKYTAEVYGTDASRLLPEQAVEETKIYLPVYGVKSGNSALLAVIDEGAEYAELYAEAGNRRTGYSTVYPTFYLRGYDVVETDQWLWGYRDLNRISDKKINAELSISFYPLSGENADFNGMADKYEEYLFGEKEENGNSDNPIYSLNILGGVTYKSAAWGIPHKELYTLTTFTQAENIVKRLADKTGLSASVMLKGFSASGIDIGKIGGGFDFSKVYGTKKDLESLSDTCGSLNAELAFDFDIVRFSKSSGGFSYILDSAKSATLRTADKYGINIPLRSYDSEEYRLLKRAKLDSAVNKLIGLAEKKNISAIGLSTLGSIAYSDFDEEQFSIKGNMASQVSGNIAKLKECGVKVYASDANSYAAVSADALLNVPENNGGYFALDEQIPFYQMVFSGRKPMYSNALNLSANLSRAVMEAVSSGIGFGFTVAENYDTVCSDSKSEQLYAVKYKAVEDTVVDLTSRYKDYYQSISNCGIKSYHIGSDGISETVFDNGVTVYANHLNNKVETDNGIFEAYEVKILK